jgi:hypothetical protein
MNNNIKDFIAISGVFLMIVMTAIPRQELNFSKIWAKGYEAGWCYNSEVACITPIIPIAPIKRLKDSTEAIIYNRGFIEGHKDKNNSENIDYGKE